MSSRQKLFRENLKRLQRITPPVAVKLQYVDPSELKWCESRSGDPNLVREVSDKQLYYHSNYNPAKEAEKWFKSMDLEHADLIYVYGVGLGYYYDAAKEWLSEDPSRYLVFLEDDLTVLRRFMETERATAILDDRQVQLHYFDGFKAVEPVVDWLTWYFLNLHPEVSALELYERERSDHVQELKRTLLHTSVGKESLTAEMSRFGAAFYRNYYANLLQLDKSYHGSRLFGQFHGVPAIICGAGPSLEKNFHVLEQLRDRALILTGGSALNALSSRGFLPHFSGGIDPNVTQLERLMTNFAFETPFLYRMRMQHKAFRAINGPRLFLNGTGGYPVSQWFEKELGLEGDVVDEGHNVINLLIDVARSMGCNPIILVGMDLAYTGMQSYAGGVVPNAGVKEETIVQSGDLSQGAFQRPDINGEPVYTLWKWVGESQWISSFNASHTDLQMINATEGGLGFRGVPNMTLQEVADQFLQKEYDFGSWVHSEVQEATIPDLSSEKILTVLGKMYDSLWRCVELTSEMLEEVEAMRERVKNGEPVPHNLQSARAATCETELVEELAYSWVMKPLAVAPFKALERGIHQIKHDWTLKTEADRQLAALNINEIKLNFLRDAARMNRLTIRVCIDDYKNEGHDTGERFAEEPGESEMGAPEVLTRETV